MLKANLDPEFRTSGHPFIEKGVKYKYNPPEFDETVILYGVIVGFIADNDVDEEGKPQFESPRTGKAATLFHVKFTDNNFYFGHHDFEEWELDGEEAVCEFASLGTVLPEGGFTTQLSSSTPTSTSTISTSPLSSNGTSATSFSSTAQTPATKSTTSDTATTAAHSTSPLTLNATPATTEAQSTSSPSSTSPPSSISIYDAPPATSSPQSSQSSTSTPSDATNVTSSNSQPATSPPSPIARPPTSPPATIGGTNRETTTPHHRPATDSSDLTPRTIAALEYLAQQSTADPSVIMEAYLSAQVTDQSTAQKIFTLAKKHLRKLMGWPTEPIATAPDNPLDENAFHFYPPNYKHGQHRSNGQDTNINFNLQRSASVALSRAVNKVVAAIKSVGDSDQIALTLREVLFHRDVLPHVTKIFGPTFSEEARVGQALVKGVRAVAKKVATNKNNGYLTKKCKSLLSLLAMLVAGGEVSEERTCSQSALMRQLLPAFKRSSAQRILKRGSVKRKCFDEEEISMFDFLDKEKKRWKYTDDEIESMRDYMVNNTHTRMSPQMNDTIRKRDLYGHYIFDSEGKHVEIQRVFCSVCPRALHLHMLKDPSEGGYAPAKDKESGDARYSLSTVVAYWPNWLTPMTDSHMSLCGCKTCIDTDDLHTALKGKRRKILHEVEAEIRAMDDGPAKVQLEEEVKQYKSEILSDDGKRHKHDKGRDAVEDYGCGKRIEVVLDGVTSSFPHFSCIIGQCKECKEKGYDAPSLELKRTGDTIKYTRFTNHATCSVHKSEAIQTFAEMTDEEKKESKATLKRRQFRTLHTMSFSPNSLGKEGHMKSSLARCSATSTGTNYWVAAIRIRLDRVMSSDGR